MWSADDIYLDTILQGVALEIPIVQRQKKSFINYGRDFAMNGGVYVYN